MPHQSRDERNPNHDPNRIDGVKWYEAVEPCQCGSEPDVWRTYIELRDRKIYAVRCPTCNHAITRTTRTRAIKDWNESVQPDHANA